MRMDVLMIFYAAYALALIVVGGKSAADGFFKKKTFESHAELLKARRDEMARKEKKRSEGLRKEGKIK